MQQVASVTAVS